MQCFKWKCVCFEDLKKKRFLYPFKPRRSENLRCCCVVEAGGGGGGGGCSIWNACGAESTTTPKHQYSKPSNIRATTTPTHTNPTTRCSIFPSTFTLPSAGLLSCWCGNYIHNSPCCPNASFWSNARTRSKINFLFISPTAEPLVARALIEAWHRPAARHRNQLNQTERFHRRDRYSFQAEFAQRWFRTKCRLRRESIRNRIFQKAFSLQP